MPTKLKENQEIQVVDYRYDEGIRGRVESEIAPTLTTKSSGYSGVPMIAKMNGGGHKMSEKTNLRIRKLTELECCRLMGFSQKTYDAIKNEFSASSIYHCCGDSIVVPVLCCLFGEMTNIDYRKAVEDYVETLKGDYE